MARLRNSERPRHFVDLFAGCGGLSLGLEQARWTPVFVNELNRDAMSTYLQNRIKKHPRLEKFKAFDIKTELVVDDKKLPDLMSGLKREFKIGKGELDLVVGGPPCQGFSGIGHRRSYSVHKTQQPSNHLYQDMVYVVSVLRPRMFLFENVRGLLNARWGPQSSEPDVWKSIRREFGEIGGYRIGWRLVFAKDYGVPQNRPRVLMVGIREDLGVSLKSDDEDALLAGLLPEGKQGAPDLIDLLGDLEKNPFVNGATVGTYPKAPQSEVQRELRRHAHKRFVTEHEYSKHSDQIVRKFAYMLDHEGKIRKDMRTKKFAQRVLPRVWDKQKGPTITACSLADDYVHYSQPRALTVREWARLQMFPDHYQFAGKRTTGGIRRAGNPRAGIFDRELPKYTQIGNAVPVKLAEQLGAHFRKLLDGART